MAPRTKLECPHEGPRVLSHRSSPHRTKCFVQVRLKDDMRTQGLGTPGVGSVKTKLVEDPLMASHRDEKEVRVYLT